MIDFFHSSGNSSLFHLEFTSWNKDEKQNGRKHKRKKEGSEDKAGENKIKKEKMHKGKKNGERTKRMKDPTQRKNGKKKKKESQDQKKSERNGTIRLQGTSGK